MTPKYRTRSLALLVALLAACDGGTDSEPITGDYSATTLSVSENGTTTNFLSRGVSLEITLNADSTTTGRLLAPDPTEPVDASLAGLWSLRGDTVRFQHSADTFVRDMPFVVRDGRLEGDRTFGDGSRYRVTLSKD
ncbi:MAG TPA: hypothetical protein VF613_25905 [Longimicrobium sp.]|jgi:hypothetical protein